MSNGMDIALAVINNQKREIQFSGAFSPLYLVRDKKLEEFKANRMPIGLHKTDEQFTAVCFPYQSGDLIYLFSDGYRDQFGGITGERFKSHRFKELLVSLSGMSVDRQASVLDKKHAAWKGNLSQIDDILIIGIELS
jgi:serine phosphatase RsbU (regulator of sigma subunit)